MEKKSSVRGEEEIEDTSKGNSISRGGGEEEENMEGDVGEWEGGRGRERRGRRRRGRRRDEEEEEEAGLSTQLGQHNC